MGVAALEAIRECDPIRSSLNRSRIRTISRVSRSSSLISPELSDLSRLSSSSSDSWSSSRRRWVTNRLLLRCRLPYVMPSKTRSMQASIRYFSLSMSSSASRLPVIGSHPSQSRPRLLTWRLWAPNSMYVMGSSFVVVTMFVCAVPVDPATETFCRFSWYEYNAFSGAPSCFGSRRLLLTLDAWMNTI